MRQFWVGGWGCNLSASSDNGAPLILAARSHASSFISRSLAAAAAAAEFPRAASCTRVCVRECEIYGCRRLINQPNCPSWILAGVCLFQVMEFTLQPASSRIRKMRAVYVHARDANSHTHGSLGEN
jgi:hypothetical protein